MTTLDTLLHHFGLTALPFDRVRVISLVDGPVGEEIEGTGGRAVRAGRTSPHAG